MPIPTQREIDNELSEAYSSIDSGTSKVPGMTYEEGVVAAIDWMLGNVEDRPMNME